MKLSKVLSKCFPFFFSCRLDQELDFIMAQQKELEEMLKPLEDAVKDGNTGGRQLQQADKERDVTSVLFIESIKIYSGRKGD